MVKSVAKESNLNVKNCITDIKSSTLKNIVKKLDLGNYEVSQLSVFSDVVLNKSYKVLCNTVNVKNPYRFLLGVCKKIEERIASNQSVPTVVKVSQDSEKVISKPQAWVRLDYMNKKVRKLTDIANDIAKLEEQIKDADKLPAFLRQEFVNGFEVSIKLLVEEEYQKEESESDMIALQYIDKFRIRYDLTPRFYTGREFTIKENVQQNNISENSNSFAIDDTW